MNFENLFTGGRDKTLPPRLAWRNGEPESWSFDAKGRLTIVPREGTDFYNGYELEKCNAALLCTQVHGDFTIVSKVSASLVGFGDAGALTVWWSPSAWAKLCLERSPIGDIAVVSVVTHGFSDDGNGELLERPECFLRITRRGNEFGMHYSRDGKSWRFVRSFVLGLPLDVWVGLHAQAPFVGGSRATFDDFLLSREAVKDFRSGV